MFFLPAPGSHCTLFVLADPAARAGLENVTHFLGGNGGVTKNRHGGAVGERIPDNPFFIPLFQRTVMAGLVRHRAKSSGRIIQNNSETTGSHFIDPVAD